MYEYENDWYPAQPSNRLDQLWITLTIPVDPMEGNVMFFFEVITDGTSRNGIFAIDYVAFLYYRCPFKQMFHYPCRDDSCALKRLWKPFSTAFTVSIKNYLLHFLNALISVQVTTLFESKTQVECHRWQQQFISVRK